MSKSQTTKGVRDIVSLRGSDLELSPVQESAGFFVNSEPRRSREDVEEFLRTNGVTVDLRKVEPLRSISPQLLGIGGSLTGSRVRPVLGHVHPRIAAHLLTLSLDRLHHALGRIHGVSRILVSPREIIPEIALG